MTFDMLTELDEWCTTVCRMTRSKVKVKVTSAWKPLKRSRPSVPHGTNLWYYNYHTATLQSPREHTE